MSIEGTGMVIRSLPFFPIISPFWMYLRRFSLMRPRMISRNLEWSCLIFSGTKHHHAKVWPSRTAYNAPLSVLRVSSGEDAGHEVEHVGGADLAVAVGLDHAV